MTTQITIPKVCCRCAQQQGVHAWKISYFSMPKPGGINGSGVPGFTIQTTTFPFEVFVCNSCKQVLARKQTIDAIIAITFALAGLTFGFWAGSGASAEDFIFRVVSVVFFGILVGSIGLYATSNFQKLGSYDGGKIKFFNKEYQRQFAILNPSFVESLSLNKLKG